MMLSNPKRISIFLFAVTLLLVSGAFLVWPQGHSKGDDRGSVAGSVDAQDQTIDSMVGPETLSAKQEPATSGPGTALEDPLRQEPVTLLFLGDMMFDRSIRQFAMKRGNDFVLAKMKDTLSKQDAVIANLEGPITGSESICLGSKEDEPRHFKFTFHPSWAKSLADNHINIVNLGNNHILNFGQDGLAQTKKYLDEATVAYFGDTGSEQTTVLKQEFNGLTIGLVSYNQFVSGSAERTMDAVNALDPNVDVVIVYTHWGMEYKPHARAAETELAHAWVDAGADLVIGTHPHVVQNKEEYNGKTIYYSLGNFVFDQYFSPETKQGLAVQVTIAPDKTMTFEELKLALDGNGQTRVIEK